MALNELTSIFGWLTLFCIYLFNLSLSQSFGTFCVVKHLPVKHNCDSPLSKKGHKIYLKYRTTPCLLYWLHIVRKQLPDDGHSVNQTSTCLSSAWNSYLHSFIAFATMISELVTVSNLYTYLQILVHHSIEHTYRINIPSFISPAYVLHPWARRATFSKL